MNTDKATPGTWIMKNKPEIPGGWRWFRVRVYGDAGRGIPFADVVGRTLEECEANAALVTNAKVNAERVKVLEEAIDDILHHAYDDDSSVEDIKADFDRMREIASNACGGESVSRKDVNAELVKELTVEFEMLLEFLRLETISHFRTDSDRTVFEDRPAVKRFQQLLQKAKEATK